MAVHESYEYLIVTAQIFFTVISCEKQSVLFFADVAVCMLGGSIEHPGYATASHSSHAALNQKMKISGTAGLSSHKHCLCDTCITPILHAHTHMTSNLIQSRYRTVVLPTHCPGNSLK